MSLASERLAELGITLPAVAAPVAAYVPALAASATWSSAPGSCRFVEGKLLATGKVGAEVSVEDAAACARTAALNAVAAVAAQAGGLDAIERVVKVVVFVASTPDFTGQPQVGNGASNVLQEVFGEQGKHARSAVGVTSLPLECAGGGRADRRRGGAAHRPRDLGGAVLRLRRGAQPGPDDPGRDQHLGAR